MRTIIVSSHGGPEVLELADLPRPKPEADEVVIDATAIGVNALDSTERQGRRQAALPFLPGHEGAGVIVRVGSKVTDLKLGDRVGWACPTKGTS
jgi:NADPH:quinone reductase